MIRFSKVRKMQNRNPRGLSANDTPYSKNIVFHSVKIQGTAVRRVSYERILMTEHLCPGGYDRNPPVMEDQVWQEIGYYESRATLRCNRDMLPGLPSLFSSPSHIIMQYCRRLFLHRLVREPRTRSRYHSCFCPPGAIVEGKSFS